MLEHAEGLFPDAREQDVTGYDPLDDLDRRGRWWNHRFVSARLVEVLAFGVALAEAEAAAWASDDGVVATRAFEDRRFLYSDRLVHWVVPLSFSAPEAAEFRNLMLELGDRLRPAPIMTGDEGIHPPGEDAFGPIDSPLVVDLGPRVRWERLADSHPGTARLWRDLSRRVVDR
jgi:hypothetical protein